MTIDAFHPVETHAPTTSAEVGEIVRSAASRGLAVFPFGGSTMLDLGLPPDRPGIAIGTKGLDRIIDYPARDMTISVEAGITIEKLQAQLRTENQRLAVDIPLPHLATLGGAIAANASGPRRYGLGTLRDYIIGIHAVNDEGHEIKGGGRVVKNVAGYDLMKLFTGSLGTLGIITRATLKLKPIPEASALLCMVCPASGLADLLDKLHATQTRPTVLEVLSYETAMAAFRSAKDAPFRGAKGGHGRLDCSGRV